MANKTTFQSRIIQKHDTKANWDKATNFIPLKGEIIVYDDLNKIKIGDGSTTVVNLPYSATTNYNDLSNKPTIGAGTITIQKNSTKIDSFSVNTTANKTINITVPTKVSDLNDDVIDGNYLPLTGGDITGSLTITDNTSNNQLRLNDILFTSATQVAECELYLADPRGKTVRLTGISYPSNDADATNRKYVDDQIAANNHIVNKYTFTATAGQSTFTIPFDFEDSSALTIYYNGVMMKETDNYTVSGKVITLVDFTAKVDDYLTVMGIEGAAAIDFGKEAADAIAEINATKKSATTEINTTKESATTEINGVKTSATNEITTVKTKAIKDINDLVATLPSDTTSLMFVNKTNTMAANSKITMDSKYTPSDDRDVATKKYVDDSKPSIVGTSTTYPIYIGSSTPASGTAPLLWIDTTSSTGVFKYRTSTTGTWTAVPVAYT